MTTQTKVRLQTVYAKFLIGGKEYTGRTIDIDTLAHVSWLDQPTYDCTAATLDALDAEMFALEDDSWDKKFALSLHKYTVNKWNLSDKQNVQFQKLCGKYLNGKKIVTVATLDEAAKLLDPNHIPF